jgi:hypothetical protein
MSRLQFGAKDEQRSFEAVDARAVGRLPSFDNAYMFAYLSIVCTSTRAESVNKQLSLKAHHFHL